MKCSEKEAVRVWGLLNKEELVSEDGEPVKVVYPGRPNDDRGADFRDAVICIAGGLKRGDIEVHAKTSDWWAHGHHRDPRYKKVVLHVVMRHDSEVMAGGKNRIPVVALEKYIGRVGILDVESGYERGVTWCCHNMSLDGLSRFLDDAGERRFLDKASIFEVGLLTADAGQCLYRGVMGALGYAKNKHPFMELADRVPLRMLETTAQSADSGEKGIIRLQALLLGTAGLMPSQRPGGGFGGDEFAGGLEREWLSMRGEQAMNYGSWNMFRVRPGNFPVRRIAAASYLVWRYREAGLLDGVLRMLGEAQAGSRSLEEGLIVADDGYWADHFDFGLRCGERDRALIGRGRAGEITVNVALPFAFAWGRANVHREIAEKAFKLYCRYPVLAVNSVEKHMRGQLGLNSKMVSSACRQQGLIYIYKSLCTQGRCGECGLHQLQPGHRVKG